MIRISKHLTLVLIMVTSIILVSCRDKIYKVVIDKKNPIEYIFNTSKDSLHSIISQQLEISNMMLWDANHGYMVLNKISELFIHSTNKSDFCLMPVYYIGKSKIYQKENRDSLDYMAWFYLHLEPLDINRTKISIMTIEPNIIIGKELIPKPPHFGRRDKKLTVEPSSIEEYSILLNIGKLIGEKNMPTLILPDDNSIVMEIN